MIGPCRHELSLNDKMTTTWPRHGSDNCVVPQKLQTSTKVGDRVHRSNRVTTLHCLSSVVKAFPVVSFVFFQMFLNLRDNDKTVMSAQDRKKCHLQGRKPLVSQTYRFALNTIHDLPSHNQASHTSGGQKSRKALGRKQTRALVANRIHLGVNGSKKAYSASCRWSHREKNKERERERGKRERCMYVTTTGMHLHNNCQFCIWWSSSKIMGSEWMWCVWRKIVASSDDDDGGVCNASTSSRLHQSSLVQYGSVCHSFPLW